MLLKNIEKGVMADSTQIIEKIASYEKFLLRDREPMTTQNTSISVSPIPMNEAATPSLDFPAIRKDLILGMDDDKRVALVKALRLRLNVSSLTKRL